MIRGGMLNIFQ